MTSDKFTKQKDSEELLENNHLILICCFVFAFIGILILLNYKSDIPSAPIIPINDENIQDVRYICDNGISINYTISCMKSICPTINSNFTYSTNDTKVKNITCVRQ